MSVLTAARAYLDAGWDIIPYARGDKGPREPNWTTKVYTIDDFTEGCNIGVRLGAIVDVDCDVPEAGRAALRLLPQTKRVHGRPSKPHSHFFFRSTEPITTMQFRDTDQSMLVELRAGSKTGVPAQTMIPPSVHPSGEQLRWEVEGDLDTVDSAHLISRVKAVAAVALCVRHWPDQGSRHDARLALCGYLLRAGASEGGVLSILELITDLTHGNRSDVERSVRDTARKLASDDESREVTGGPKLAEILGADVVKILNRIVGCEDRAVVDDVVTELNARHFVIRIGKDELVGNDDGEHLVFQSPAAVAFRYENQTVKVGEKEPKKGEKDGEPIYQTKFKIWRSHPDRREHRTLCFAPPPLTAHKEDYNLWRGFAIEPREGSCDRLLHHIRTIICAGNEEHYAYLMDLLAFGVQFPGHQSHIATVLRGAQGTGKSIFVEAYGSLFGKHFIALSKRDDLVGKFNDHLSGKCVVFADEAFFAGDPTITGPLKSIITQPTIQIERKGVDQYTEPNCIKLFMATNSEWAVPAEFKERRMFVLDVADSALQDHDYFEDLLEELANGGREAFLHQLLQRPVDRKKLRKAPTTDALRSQQDLSLKPELRWWKDCLTVGAIGIDPTWPEWISSQDFYWAYITWCETLKISRRASSVELMRRLGKFLKGSKAERKVAPQRDEYGRRDHGHKTLCRGWKLPTLSAARKQFDLERGSLTSWPRTDGDADLDPSPDAQPETTAEPLPF